MSKAKKENKHLKYLKSRANRLYKDMTQAMKNAEEEHKDFHEASRKYAKVLLQIQEEIKNPKKM